MACWPAGASPGRVPRGLAPGARTAPAAEPAGVPSARARCRWPSSTPAPSTPVPPPCCPPSGRPSSPRCRCPLPPRERCHLAWSGGGSRSGTAASPWAGRGAGARAGYRRSLAWAGWPGSWSAQRSSRAGRPPPTPPRAQVRRKAEVPQVTTLKPRPPPRVVPSRPEARRWRYAGVLHGIPGAAAGCPEDEQVRCRWGWRSRQRETSCRPARGQVRGSWGGGCPGPALARSPPAHLPVRSLR